RGVVTFPSFYFTIIPPILSASRRREAVSCSEHVERRPRRLARQGRRGREEAGWSICSTTYRGPRRGSFSSPWCSSWRGPGGTPGSCSTFSRSSCSGTLLVFALLGNLLEELLFRGYVYNNFRTKDVDLRAGVICGIVGAKYGVLPAAVVHGGAIFMFTSGIMNVCFRGVIPFASAFGRIPTASSTRTRSSCRSNCSDRMWPMTRSHSGFTRRLTAGIAGDTPARTTDPGKVGTSYLCNSEESTEVRRPRSRKFPGRLLGKGKQRCFSQRARGRRADASG